MKQLKYLIILSFFSFNSFASNVCDLKITQIKAESNGIVSVVLTENGSKFSYNFMTIGGQNMVSLAEKAYFLDLNVCANLYETNSGPYRVVELTLHNQ